MAEFVANCIYSLLSLHEYKGTCFDCSLEANPRCKHIYLLLMSSNDITPKMAEDVPGKVRNCKI